MQLLKSLLNGLASLFGLQARTALPPLPVTKSSRAQAPISQADVLTRPGRLEPAPATASAFPATMILRPGARPVPPVASAPAPIDPAVRAHAELRAHAQRLRANAKARQARDEAAAADSGFAATDFMDFPETVVFPRKKSRN